MKALVVIIFLIFFSYAVDENQTDESIINQKVSNFLTRLKEIDAKLKTENIWLKKYASFYTYKQLKNDIAEIDSELEKLNKKKKSEDVVQQIEALTKKKVTLENQISLLKEFETNPFGELITIGDIKKPPEVESPLGIISAFSFIKQLQQKKESLEDSKKQLLTVIDILTQKKELLKELDVLIQESKIKKELEYTQSALDELNKAVNIFSTTVSVYQKKSDEIIVDLTEQIKHQGKKSLVIFTLIIFLFIAAFLIKFAAKKYINDNERLYTTNKIINFINFSLIALILLFSYIENVGYMVTVLGFASAGLAIAMKDLFMSILGWIVIIIGGSIHVGDRIRIVKDGNIFVGDVLDISLLRITIYEDVTLTSYLINRRAGRIIFIPNNYIFTNLIANYTHANMKTVWDGIDFTVTFDSNFKKAMQIAKDVAKKYSKGYTEITRKQLNMLRDKYSVRNSSVEPRVFSLIEPNGVRISVWYLTNSYAILTLRSTISGEIIEEIQKESDIKIAYPITEIKIGNQPINILNTQPPSSSQIVPNNIG